MSSGLENMKKLKVTYTEYNEKIEVRKTLPKDGHNSESEELKAAWFECVLA